jgi:hypothetical protein
MHVEVICFDLNKRAFILWFIALESENGEGSKHRMRKFVHLTIRRRRGFMIRTV